MKRLIALLSLLALRSACQASTAYGDLNNFDVVNDTGGKCHGFEIELDDVRSTEITYTYDWNHYGHPQITEDQTDALHPKVRIRYQARKNPDGSYAAFTNPQDPASPLTPTDGHSCTDPSVNLGCEHFGVGYYGSPSAVRYFWLVDDATNPGTLVRGPIVNVSTPRFVYYPPVPPPVFPNDPPAAPAVLQMFIEPPEDEVERPEDQYGVPVWVKMYKTVQKNGKKVKLDELVSDDPEDPDDKHWAGDEEPETEIEWMVFQAKPAKKLDEGEVDEFEASDELPEGDETVTRRYEFYVYNGPVNEEDGEAQCDNPDDCADAVGAYIGAQMAGFNVESPLGLIDHIQDGEVAQAFVPRTVIVGGNSPYTLIIRDGALPNGLSINPEDGVLTGIPDTAGVFSFTVEATDADGVNASMAYTMMVAKAFAIQTSSLPEGQEKQAYSASLTVEGGTPPYLWSSSGLPNGLTLDTDGTLSGAPAVGTAGQRVVSISVTEDTGRTQTVELALSILAAPLPPAVRGDINGDSYVDRSDLSLVTAARNQPSSGPGDKRDLDGDGVITVKDARIVATLFTRPAAVAK
jgi:hypothetical protein